MVDFTKIEKKWQNKWEKSKIFESNPDKRKKFFVNFYKDIVNKGVGKIVGSYYNNKLVSALMGYCYKDRIHIVIEIIKAKCLTMILRWLHGINLERI